MQSVTTLDSGGNGTNSVAELDTLSTVWWKGLASLGIDLNSGGGKGNPGWRQVMFAVLQDGPYRIRTLAIGGAVARLVQAMCPELAGLGAGRTQADDDGSEQARGGHVCHPL